MLNPGAHRRHRFVIVGGGVAGVSCAQECAREMMMSLRHNISLLRPSDQADSASRSENGGIMPAPKRVRSRQKGAAAPDASSSSAPGALAGGEKSLPVPEGPPILLIAATEQVKYIETTTRITEHLEDVIVFEKSIASFAADINAFSLGIGLDTHGNGGGGGLVGAMQAQVCRIDPERHLVFDKDGNCLAAYDRLCFCTGAVPLLPGPIYAAWLRDRDAEKEWERGKEKGGELVGTTYSGGSISCTGGGVSGGSVNSCATNRDHRMITSAIQNHSRILVLRDLDTAQALIENIMDIAFPSAINDVHQRCEHSDACSGLTPVDEDAALPPEEDGGDAVVIVGNGGIALELVHLLSFCNLVWIVRDNYMGNTFFDASCTPFIMPLLRKSRRSVSTVGLNCGKSADGGESAGGNGYGLAEPSSLSTFGGVPYGATESAPMFGCGLGPDWMRGLRDSWRGHSAEEGDERGEGTGTLKICFNDEVLAVEDLTLGPGTHGKRLLVTTRQGHRIRGRLLVAATGVAPLCGVKVVHESGGGTGCAESNVALGYDSVPVKNNFPMEPVQFGHRSSVQSSYSGGIVVDDAMRTGLRDVYAAGDCCTLAHWTERSPDWLPMRLWSQARDSGIYAARCMIQDTHLINNTPGSAASAADTQRPFSFELFSHVTHFFGMKVVLLGRFNAQGLDIATGGAAATCTRYYSPPRPSSSDFEVVEEQKMFPDLENTRSLTGEVSCAENLEIWVRIREGTDLVKLIVVRDGAETCANSSRQRVVGAVLAGDTGLEEVVENLILDRTDVSRFGPSLLDPDADLEGYFD